MIFFENTNPYRDCKTINLCTPFMLLSSKTSQFYGKLHVAQKSSILQQQQFLNNVFFCNLQKNI